jgi:hypothetical protein
MNVVEICTHVYKCKKNETCWNYSRNWMKGNKGE